MRPDRVQPRVEHEVQHALAQEFSEPAGGSDVAGLAFWLGDTPARVPEQYRLASPAAFVTADDPPMFFFHGENDDLVPRVSPTQMAAALTAVGVPNELYVVPHCGHIMACMNWPAIERSAAFLEKHLKPQAQP